MPLLVARTRLARRIPALAVVPLALAASCRPSDAARGAKPAAASDAAAERVRWGPAEPLGVGSSATPGAAAAFAVEPAAGRVSAGWVDAPAQGRDAHLVVRPDLAAPAVDTVRDPGGGLTVYGETPPKLVYAPGGPRAGTLYAAYLVTRAVPGHKWPVNALRLASSRDGGRTWSAPRTVQSDAANGGSTDDHALAVAADGSLVLTWLAMTGHDSHTYLARSTDGGVTWSAPRVVDAGPSCPCCRTAVAAGPDGALYAAWRKIFPAPAGGPAAAPPQVRDIAVARSADGGRTWGAPVRVHADEWRVDYCPDAGPSLRVGADGAVHVAWWTGKEGAAGVRYARSADGGRTFGEPVPLGVGARSKAAHVQLAVAGCGEAATVAAVWEDGTRQAAPLVARVSRDGGRTFGPADVLSAAGAQVGYPVVALEGDRGAPNAGATAVRVAWQQRPADAGARDSARMAATEAASTAAEHHHGAMPDASRWIQPVGAWQVVTRVGTLASGAGRTQLAAAR